MDGPPGGEFKAVLYFAESARELVSRGLGLAQECGAQEILPEHLLLSSSPEALERTGLVWFRDQIEKANQGATIRGQVPEFGAEVLGLFEQAFKICVSLVEETHLLLSLDLKKMKRVFEVHALSGLFSPEVTEVLERHKVDVSALLAEVGTSDVLTLLPGASFFQTRAGQRLVDLLLDSDATNRTGNFFQLLTIQLQAGPVSAAFSRYGLSEPLLIALLISFAKTGIEALLESADLEDSQCLGSDTQRLTKAAKLALIIGWNCSGRGVLEAQNLLDGLLCSDILCQPGQGATKVLHTLNVVGFAHSATREMITTYDASIRVPRLSGLVQQAIRSGLKVAEPGRASTEHLLYGLAAIHLDELITNGVTPDRILRHL